MSDKTKGVETPQEEIPAPEERGYTEDQAKVFKGQFRPSAERLREIARKGGEIILNSTEEELEDFRE